MAEVRGLGGAGLRVMTWNLHGGSGPDLTVLARAVAAEAPDVLALQEVREGQSRRLAELSGAGEARWLLKHRPLLVAARSAEGIAVLTRFPVAAERSAVLSRGASSRSFRRRVLQTLVVTTPAGPVRIVNAHLSSDSASDRADQGRRAVTALAEPLDGVGPERTVLLGDLNTDDADEVVGELGRAGLRDAWADRHPGADARERFTNPSQAPTQRLDHVLVGRGFDVEQVRVPAGGPAWAALSDHLPVVADLRVR